MNYPLISEYVEAVRSAEDNFDKLSDLRPVLDDGGNPVMSSGNFAVVFKMQDMNTDRIYALKCFTKEQEGREDAYRQIADEFEYVQSTYLAKVVYYDRELFVDTQSSDESEFPVLLMDWVEGMTLDRYIRQNIDDKYALEMLAYNFSRLAMWLLPQPFAHGDLKPDNILVQEDGSLTLVDYDGMYVPAMQGQKSRELGSPDFRHPLRTQEDFNEHIDDFPAISILLSLSLIASDPSLLDRYGASDRLLFAESDYRDISSCQLLKTVFPSQQTDINTLVSLFTIACAHKTLSQVSFRLMAVEKPKKPAAQPILVDEELLTEVTEEDLENAIVDEFGVKYSRDGKHLLNGAYVESYKIREGTKVICNNTFCFRHDLREIVIPRSVEKLEGNPFLGSHCKVICRSPYYKVVDNVLYDSRMTLIVSFLSDVTYFEIPSSVTRIGNGAFGFCKFLQKIVIPSSVTSIGNDSFCECSSLQEVVIPSSVTSIGNDAFIGCTSLHEIVIPSNVTSIGNDAFARCDSLKEIVIPSGIASIGNNVFGFCYSLQKVVIPSSITSIGDYAFDGCHSLREVVVPSSVKTIGKNPFFGLKCKIICKSPYFRIVDNVLYDDRMSLIISFLSDATNFEIPSSVTSLGDSAFGSCSSLREIVIPSSVTNIGVGAFEYTSLQKIIIPSSVTSIGSNTFGSCESLREVVIPSSVTSIGNGAFWECSSLQEVVIPSSVTSLGTSIFYKCTSLQKIEIPPSVTCIENSAFSFCESLREIVIPSSVTSIGNSAFSFCKNLREIKIPSNVTHIGDGVFSDCSSLQEIVIPSNVTHIGDRAFSYCKSLHKIKIPKGSRAKFEKLLPDFKEILIEIDNI